MVCLGLSQTTELSWIKTVKKSETQNEQLVRANPTPKAAFSVQANILGDYACKHLLFSDTSHHKTRFKVSWLLLVG